MESGSQMCSGICADLPMAPTNRSMQPRSIAGQLTPGHTVIRSADIDSAPAKTTA